MDADGDGVSDIAAASSTSFGYQVRVALSATGKLVTFPLTGEYVFGGDIAGDGISSFVGVSVGSRIQWHIRRIGAGTVEEVTFGGEPDTILGGCRFVSASRSGLSYVRGRELHSRDVISNEERTYRLRGYFRGTAVGCADVTGDGIDELLVKTTGRNIGKSNLLAIQTGGRRVFSKDVKPFASIGVIRREEGGPILAVERINSDETTSSELLSFGTNEVHEAVGASGRIRITGALLPSSADAAGNVILWQDGRKLFQRILPNDGPSAGRVRVGSLPVGFTLLPEVVAIQTRRAGMVMGR
jgi:hypothetical protein